MPNWKHKMSKLIPDPKEPQQKGFVSTFRTTVTYALPGPDTVAMISAMGFSSAQFTAEEAEMLRQMCTIGRALAGDINPKLIPLSGFLSTDGQRRLMAVWNTVPTLIVAQVGPAVARFSAIAGPQGEPMLSPTPGATPPEGPSQDN